MFDKEKQRDGRAEISSKLVCLPLIVDKLYYKQIDYSYFIKSGNDIYRLDDKLNESINELKEGETYLFQIVPMNLIPIIVDFIKVQL